MKEGEVRKDKQGRPNDKRRSQVEFRRNANSIFVLSRCHGRKTAFHTQEF